MLQCTNNSRPAPVVPVAVRSPAGREIGYLKAFLDTGADRSVFAPHTLPYLEEFVGQIDMAFFETAERRLSLALGLEISFDGGDTWFTPDDWIEISETIADYPGLASQEDLVIGRDVLHHLEFCCDGLEEKLSLHVPAVGGPEAVPPPVD